MSDDRLDENTPTTPWFMRQVSEERGEGEHRPSFPAWLQQEDDDSAAADVAALELGDDDAPAAPFIPATVDDVAADPTDQEPGELPADQGEEASDEAVEAVEDVEDVALEPADLEDEPGTVEDEPGTVEPLEVDAPAEPQPEGDSALLAVAQAEPEPAEDAEEFSPAAEDGEGDEDSPAAVAADEAADAAPIAGEAVEFAQPVEERDEPQAEVEAVESPEDSATAVEADFVEESVAAQDAAEQWPVDTADQDTAAEEAEPVEAEPIEAEPVGVQPVEAEPIDVQPVEAELVEAEPTYVQPVDVQPVEAELVEAEPAQEESEDAPLVVAAPEESVPVEQAPAEPVPGEEQAVEAEPAPETDVTLEADSAGAALPPLPSRRSRRHASWLDALEEEKQQEELAAQEQAGDSAVDAEPLAELAAPEPAEEPDSVSDISPLTPTEFENAASPGFAHIDAAAPTPQGATPELDEQPEADTTAVRRYSLLAAVGAAPTAAAAWKPTESEETEVAKEAPLSDGSYRAAPAEAVLGMPVAQEATPAPAPEGDAAMPAEPDWREALQATRTDAGEAKTEEPSAPEAAPAWNPLTESDAVSTVPTPEPKESSEAAVLEGASIKPAPISRAAAHWWSVFFTLLLVPIGWFLVTDATAQLTAAQLLEEGREVSLVAPPIWPMTELVLGGIAVALAVFVARWSSVGSILLGSILTAIGGLFAFAPQQVTQWFGPLLNDFLVYNSATQKFVLSFLADGISGRILLGGIVLIFLGVVSHGARRQGRREQANYDLVGRRKRRKK